MDLRSANSQNGMNGEAKPDECHYISDADLVKIMKMREIIAKDDPAPKVADDATLRRFLYARESNVQHASELYIKYRKWRQTFVPHGCISETVITNELKKNMVCMQGFDKKGRPIAVVILKRHKPCHKALEDTKRYFVYTFDKMASRTSSGQEKFTIIVDLEGWTYKHVDIRGYLALLEILQNYYPERLGKLYFIHLPYIFWAAWNIVCPFVDKKTKQKVSIVENKDIRTTLLMDIDESQLPEIYGGKLPLVPVQDAVVPNLPAN
ncbi:hypothetical protein SUGI_0288090 [Cryptomeria japonica]|uniref:sec14 cytosolic factor n=1 Tax=Cryptomeria japonica TaxID=3369 RepID=UPI00240899AC|nr:sec14 cytosolic factor [Cryptomeria japonica]GLJ16742.1 hypothetical protein SUGI_0288090 [Cryptomeria japonica]